MEQQAGLKFIKFDVTKVLFDRGNEIKVSGKYNINVNCNWKIKAENANLFQTIFIIDVIDQEEKEFSFQVKALGYFEIMGAVVPSARQNFMNISAPAIVYPYIRSFISNLVLQSGMHPIILPTMNFAINATISDTEKRGIKPKKSPIKKKKSIN